MWWVIEICQMTMYGFSWRVSQSPRQRCVRCIMMSLATTVMSHENAPNIEFSFVSFWVWNNDNSRNQTLIIGRLFQSCISNHSQQEKLEHLEYIFVTFTKFLLWANLWYFGADKEAVLCQTLLPRDDLNISNVFAQSLTKQNVVNLTMRPRLTTSCFVRDCANTFEMLRSSRGRSVWHSTASLSASSRLLLCLESSESLLHDSGLGNSETQPVLRILRPSSRRSVLVG